MTFPSASGEFCRRKSRKLHGEAKDGGLQARRYRRCWAEPHAAQGRVVTLPDATALAPSNPGVGAGTGHPLVLLLGSPHAPGSAIPLPVAPERSPCAAGHGRGPCHVAGAGVALVSGRLSALVGS